ncbi:MAG TPA: hypothetical protein VHK06_05230 [Candidatus Limnocylindria bacterium]|nr:hypothetical protein [Candidatus Limnocylindria bacterium]
MPSPRSALSRALLGLAVLGALVASRPAVALGTEPDGREAQRSGSSRTLPGYDISYPQCGGTFPKDPAFAIVGVNGGRVYSVNPCLGAGNGPSELAWGGRSTELYANTGNPGPELSSFWPDGQSYPRPCNTSEVPGRDTHDCAYDYGWNAAKHSYATAVAAYISLGWAEEGATRTPVDNHWWLDVETSNSWRDEVSLNVATLRGAVDYLESVGVASVGFYSTGYQWGVITGGTRTFADHASWVAGARTLQGARRNCTATGFTGGAVVYTQYFANGFDADYRC